MLSPADYQLRVVDQIEPEQDYHDSGDYYAEDGVAREKREHQNQKYSHPIIYSLIMKSHI
jgi:hypothetical protein